MKEDCRSSWVHSFVRLLFFFPFLASRKKEFGVGAKFLERALALRAFLLPLPLPPAEAPAAGQSHGTDDADADERRLVAELQQHCAFAVAAAASASR